MTGGDVVQPPADDVELVLAASPDACIRCGHAGPERRYKWFSGAVVDTLAEWFGPGDVLVDKVQHITHPDGVLICEGCLQ